MVAFGTKELKGEASAADWLRFLKSFPPELRVQLAQRPEGKIFRPETYEPMIATLEQLVSAVDDRQTPSSSQLAAQLQIVRTGLGFDVLKMFGQLPSVGGDIKRHVEKGTPLRPGALEIHDKALFAFLRMFRTSENLSPLLHERMQIAAQSKDAAFKRRLTDAFKKDPDVRPDRLLQDLQVSVLKRELLGFWTEIPNVEESLRFTGTTRK